MTESEIMKALECHKEADIDNCCDCPYFCIDGCAYQLSEEALDLINRKNEQLAEKDAEIEKLCGEIDELIIAKDQLFDEAEALIKKARAEAIKEFAERVKEAPIKCGIPLLGLTTKDEIEEYFNGIMLQVRDAINQIAKEMGVEL